MKFLVAAAILSTASSFVVKSPQPLSSSSLSVATETKKEDLLFGAYSLRTHSSSMMLSTSRLTLSLTLNDVVDETRASVSNYYGKELSSSEDLKTNACCTAGAPPKYIQDAINNINPEVVSKYYGCGLCLPQYPLEGAKILDLGCGAGRDVYIASQLVGASGKVVGVDMTEEQLAVAKKHQEYHAEKFGFSNVEFRQGYLEQLADLKLEAGSFGASSILAVKLL